MGIYCYQHNIDKWRRKTSHLSFEERGAYRELMDAYYATDGHLPADLKALYRITGAQGASERKAISKIISEFFKEKNGYFHQETCDEILQAMKDKSEKASSSVGVRYNKTKDIASTNVPTNVERTYHERTTDELLTNNQEPITNKKAKQQEAVSPKNLNEKATEIIASLDNALKEFYGQPGERLAPTANDFVTAKGWLDAGATPESCIGIIQTTVARQHAAKKPPIHSLAYFEKAIISALAKPALPDMTPTEQAPLTLPPEIVAKLQSNTMLSGALRTVFDKCKFDLEHSAIYARSKFAAEHIRNKYQSDLNACFKREITITFDEREAA